MSKVLSACDLTKDDIALFEINEAFSVVALANIKIMELNPDRVNINGGMCSIVVYRTTGKLQFFFLISKLLSAKILQSTKF